MTTSFHTINLSNGVEISFSGLKLDHGPLPAIFYFALSAQQSLCVDPFNQPVVCLESKAVRIFSMDLPDHGPDQQPQLSLSKWAERIARGEDPISDFLDKLHSSINLLIEQNVLIEDKIAVMGLSRGGFIACHAAAKMPFIKHILGFAPLTQLPHSKDFKHIHDHPTIEALKLERLVPIIYDRTFRFYIGNRDVLVSTKHCFNFVELLVEKAFENHLRSPKIELFIVPSIGHLGHGTSKESFTSGAQWLAEKTI